MTYLSHLLINTGQVRRSERGDFSDAVIYRVRRIIFDAIVGMVTPMPDDSFQLSAASTRGAVLLTIWRGDDPWATIAAAPSEREGRKLWRRMMDDVKRTNPRLVCAPPAAPYVATIAWPAIENDLDAADWIEDYGLAAGWAWLELLDD